MNRSSLEGRKQVLQERTQPEFRVPEELRFVQENSSSLQVRSRLNGAEGGRRVYSVCPIDLEFLRG